MIHSKTDAFLFYNLQCSKAYEYRYGKTCERADFFKQSFCISRIVSFFEVTKLLKKDVPD